MTHHGDAGPEGAVTRSSDTGAGGPGRPPDGPGREEDGINLLKAAERAGNEGWASDTAGGYTDRDGCHRNDYGDRD
jgi:hypothetical protein